jgi:hypothetical protein
VIVEEDDEGVEENHRNDGNYRSQFDSRFVGHFRSRLDFAVIARERVDAEAFARYRIVLVIDLANAVSRTSFILAQVDLFLTSLSIIVVLANALKSRINVHYCPIRWVYARPVINVFALFEVQARLVTTRSLVCLTRWP